MNFVAQTRTRFRFTLARDLGRTVYGVYDPDTDELIEPGVIHMLAREERYWELFYDRLAKEANSGGGSRGPDMRSFG